MFGEPEHPLVEVHPLVHPAQLDVADDVVDGVKYRPADARLAGGQRVGGHVSGQVGPA